jgi:hypothetical protein
MTHRIDPERLTVVYTDEHGEEHDLNAQGEPCATADDLAEFVAELHAQGAYDAAVCDAMLEQVPQ